MFFLLKVHKVKLLYKETYYLRRGIALLITIALVATITALIAVSSGILEHSFKRISNKQMLIQSNVFLSKFVEILKNASSQVSDAITLDIFLIAPLSFENKAHLLHVDISFTSEASAPNINLMLENNSTNAPSKAVYNDYFEQILSIYNISDKILLLSMIEDSLDSDYQERISGSEIALLNPFFMQGEIYSYRHFMQIIEAYKEITRDASVDEIAWDKLIGYKGKGVDINHINSEVLMMLHPSIDPNSVALYTTERVDVYNDFDALVLDAEAQRRFKDINVTFYSPLVKAKMSIADGDEALDVLFSYNLETQKVSDIEIQNP